MASSTHAAPSAGAGAAPGPGGAAHVSSATRYLCGAAHIDPAFARSVLTEVLHQPFRAVAPSYGISLRPIIAHSLLAQARRRARDIVLVGAWFSLLVFGPAPGVLVAIVIADAYLFVRGCVLALRGARRPGLRLIVTSILVLWILFPIFTLGVLGRDDQSAGSVARWAVWLLSLFTAWGACAWYRSAVHRTIAEELAPEVFRRDRTPAVRPEYRGRVAYLDAEQAGNVTIYSDDWAQRPFLGSGSVALETSLVTPFRPSQVDLDRPAQELDVDEIYQRLRQGLLELSRDSTETARLLEVHERLFVAGRTVRSHGLLDPGTGLPRTSVLEASLRDARRVERGPLRHYLCVRMVSWDGELEVTVFVHVRIRGELLFLEIVATMLPGIDPAYHAIDTVERFDGTAAVSAALRGLGDVLTFPLSVVNLWGDAAERMRHGRKANVTRRDIERRLTFDYGARVSVRELGSLNHEPIRFQSYDAAERVSFVRHRILEALVSTLRDHGYDVSDLVEQVANIITLGNVVVGNNNIVGDGNAVGANAFSQVFKQPSPGDPGAAGGRV